MQSMKNYARYVELLCISIIPISISVLCIKWFFGFSPFFDSLISWIDYSMISSLNPANFWLSQRILGFLVDGIALCIFIAGLLSAIKLMRLFQQEQFFSERAIALLNTITKIAFFWAIYAPINYSLLSLITSLHCGVGNRIIAASIGLSDILNISIFLFLVIVTSILKKGYGMQREQDLTI